MIRKLTTLVSKRKIKKVSKKLTKWLQNTSIVAMATKMMFIGMLPALAFSPVVDKTETPVSEINTVMSTDLHQNVLNSSIPRATVKIVESEADRLAREEAERQAATKTVTRTVVAAKPVVNANLDELQIYAQKRSAELFGDGHFEALYYIIQRESGWSVGTVNSSSGACGLGQALPCSKLGDAYGDGIKELEWVLGYIQDRYGTPNNALAFWNAHRWY